MCRHVTLKVANSTLVCQEHSPAPGANHPQKWGALCSELGRLSMWVRRQGLSHILVCAAEYGGAGFSGWRTGGATRSWLYIALMLAPQAALLAAVLVNVLVCAWRRQAD